jgi:hypothetical protein
MTDDELLEMIDDWENLSPGEQGRVRSIVQARNRKRSTPGNHPAQSSSSSDYPGAYEDEGTILRIIR